MSDSNKINIRVDWQNEMNRVATKYHVIGSWVAIILNPLWFIADYFTIPDYWENFLIVRLFVSGITLLAVLLRKLINLSIEMLIAVPLLGISIQNAYMWSVMDIPTLQKHAFAYLALIVAGGMLVLWKPIWTIMVLALSIIANALFFHFYSALPMNEILINGGLLVLTVGIISVVLIQSRFTLTKKEIIARLALEVTIDKLEVQKELIEEKNNEITSSINYALRIQSAILPSLEDISAAFTESFVLFRPKDIVSGDFYFYTNKHNLEFIAAVDCTGHGVPGAFMSMIGAEKLDEGVELSSSTSEILRVLNTGIKTSLKQSDLNDDSTRDGMDLALCSVDTVNRVVNYSGANRPLWIIRKGAAEIEEIKATKKAIGGFTVFSQAFESHTVQLNEGDTFYLCSDGYADTFNGETGKKMNTKRFKEMLVNIQSMSMNDQQRHLSDFLDNWKGQEEQVDDILVIGVRM
jgi:sigma-B regulation protein RsbU (phosphoserine phosphatase)